MPFLESKSESTHGHLVTSYNKWPKFGTSLDL